MEQASACGVLSLQGLKATGLKPAPLGACSTRSLGHTTTIWPSRPYAPSAITRFFFIQGIIERNSAPTFSIGCFWPASRSRLKFLRPVAASPVHPFLGKFAGLNVVQDDLHAFLRAALSITMGPRVKSPYSAVFEIE